MAAWYNMSVPAPRVQAGLSSAAVTVTDGRRQLASPLVRIVTSVGFDGGGRRRSSASSGMRGCRGWLLLSLDKWCACALKSYAAPSCLTVPPPPRSHNSWRPGVTRSDRPGQAPSSRPTPYNIHRPYTHTSRAAVLSRERWHDFAAGTGVRGPPLLERRYGPLTSFRWPRRTKICFSVDKCGNKVERNEKWRNRGGTNKKRRAPVRFIGLLNFCLSTQARPPSNRHYTKRTHIFWPMTNT